MVKYYYQNINVLSGLEIAERVDELTQTTSMYVESSEYNATTGQLWICVDDGHDDELELEIFNISGETYTTREVI